ncbi:MAG TPA: alpha-hydroxy acid oxidase [Candidatus Eisenbacteria bacterium]|nr:alpha-hydroxy acid oxidase [Candidatus Eisenbacteria bacterium]
MRRSKPSALRARPAGAVRAKPAKAVRAKPAKALRATPAKAVRATPGRDAASEYESCACVTDLEEVARARLPRSVYDYYAGGAEDEQTLEANRDAFRHVFLRPRALVGVSAVDPSTSVLGVPVSMPVLIAPTAYQRMAHPDGELATARAAGAAGTIMIVSTIATCSLEEVAAAATGPLWFQLYMAPEREICRDLLRRAEAAGYRAICLTVDTPVLGRRERDVRNRFSLPPGLTLRNFEGDRATMPRTKAGSGFAVAASRLIDSSLTWDSVAWIRSETKLPIVVKGVIAAADADLAVQAGVSGIVVSNHGGRQLDGCEPTLRALPHVVEAVAGRVEVLMDGGVRRGTDVLKALGLGARAVLVGRPVLWGLAAGGEQGVRFTLEMMRSELVMAMGLSGCPTVGAITRELIAS